MPACLKREDCVLLCIDFQERLLQKIHMAEEIVKNAAVMVNSAKTLNVPIIVTEQYPKGLGKTDKRLVEALGNWYKPIEKVYFNCFKSGEFVNELEKHKRRSLLTMGVEAHICVTQTALGALKRNYQVYLLEDATSSRTPENRRIAFDRMVNEGVVPTSVEMVIYEMLEKSGTEEFKKILNFVK
ncbi:MAG: hydrolase [Candidatus Bathyarchaeia archaeon]